MQKQEKLERKLNANLTSVEDLNAWAESDDPHIEKELITFNGKEITVYHLKGFSDFKFLGHVINYREGDPISVGGREISERLADNPSYWYETPNDYKEAKNWDIN